MIYDYIIYPANLSAVTAALRLTEKNKNVLLLNHYGFTGGNITEELCLFQRIEPLPVSISKNIYEDLINRNDALFFSRNKEFILNPEVVKIVLQEFLERSKVNMLFHVTPVETIVQDDFVSLILSGKEGKIEVSARKVIDTSANFSIARLDDHSPQIKSLGINLISSKLNDDSFASFKMIDKYFKLNDNRYFIGLNLLTFSDIHWLENDIQNVVNQFEKILQEQNGRIQLIAPQAWVKYKTPKLREDNFVLHCDQFINHFSQEEEFMKAAMFESRVGEMP